jgi:hypothetical protein
MSLWERQGGMHVLMADPLMHINTTTITRPSHYTDRYCPIGVQQHGPQRQGVDASHSIVPGGHSLYSSRHLATN